MRLRDRNRAIPNGLVFFHPKTKSPAPLWTSFSGQVSREISVRAANPGLGLTTDRAAVEREVEEYLCQVCLQMSAQDFVDTRRDVGDGGVPDAQRPFTFAPPTIPPLNRRSVGQRLAAIPVGINTLYRWISSKEEAVPGDKANARAAGCVKCPYNEKGNWLDWFTTAGAGAVSRALEQRRGWNLTTAHDENLGTCGICGCHLALKVHTPISVIIAEMPAEVRDHLHPDCWVRSEEAATQ